MTAPSQTSQPPYRGRLAPSPTGLLHLGHARTFWTAQERAQADHGTLVLRNENLDAARCRPEFVSAMFEDLRWFGFNWQEGPDCGGSFGPYAQSERHALYLAALEHLHAGGFIYPCTCSRKDILGSVTAPHEGGQMAPTVREPTGHPLIRPPGTFSPTGGEGGDEGEPFMSAASATSVRHTFEAEPLYPGTCRSNRKSQIKNQKFSWRFLVPDGETISFIDGRLGPQQFLAGKDFGDFVVWRPDDIPAYQLAVVVDDAAMRITEVVRGEDLLLSTARQLLLYRALALTAPAFYHCPLMKDDTGQRLAKRHDALSLRALRAGGVSPDACRAKWH